MTSQRALLAIASVFFHGATAWADWPHLRGPSLDAVSTEIGLAESWPIQGSPVLWSRELGQGHSGFIIAEGMVFTQRQTLGGQYVLCLNPDTGQTIWESRYDWAWQPKGAYPGPYSSPTWYRGRVYYASPAGQVGCLDAKSGASLWSLNVREQFQGQGFGFGYAITPYVADDLVILPVGGPSASIVALHADDGRTVWRTGSDPASYCPAVPITIQGQRCIVGYLQNALILVDFATGKLLHRQSLSSGYDEHSAWPLYREPHLLLLSPFRLPAQRLELRPGPEGAILCSLQWTSRELCNDILSSVLYRGHVFGFDLKQQQASAHRPSRGAFKCLDWDTGAVRWSTDRVGHASVLVADDKLFMLTDAGSLILARADSREYVELGRMQLFADEICWTPPSLLQGRLFARSSSRGVCIYVGRAEDLPGELSPIVLEPAPRSWRLDSTLLMTREREYPNDAPSPKEMTLWFGIGVISLCGAALVTGLAVIVGRCALGRYPACSGLFWGIAFLLGLLGPNVFSAFLDRCLFTWPLSLYVAFHATVLACLKAEQPPGKTRSNWHARIVIVGFLFVCYGYFELCKAVGMFIGWSFLFGFPLAFPMTFLAAHSTIKRKCWWIGAGLTLLGFAAYFWGGWGLLLWKVGHEG